MEKTNICPLLTAAAMKENGTGTPHRVCLEEKCAWYSIKQFTKTHKEEGCALLIIAGGKNE